MNLSLQQYNILNKTKTIALSTLKFWQQACFIIIEMFVKYLCDHQNSFSENLFFGSPEKLRKCSFNTSSVQLKAQISLCFNQLIPNILI
jgi:hypothetical protein